MAINDRTRKILWAWSGNQCAMCPQKLIEEATEHDKEAVVGRECHIISRKGKGPRHDPAFPDARIDSIKNLLLLCPTHHAIVDDRENTYTAEQLQEIKKKHEAKMQAARQGSQPMPQLRFARTKDEIPKKLRRVMTGKELIRVLESTDSMYFRHPSVLTAEDADLFGGFAQDLQDWEMLISDNEVRLRIEAELALNEALNDLFRNGCALFWAIEKQRLEGTPKGAISWRAAHFTIVRIDDPAIVWEEDRQDQELEGREASRV